MNADLKEKNLCIRSLVFCPCVNNDSWWQFQIVQYKISLLAFVYMHLFVRRFAFEQPPLIADK